jgi:hypothetical protein
MAAFAIRVEKLGEIARFEALLGKTETKSADTGFVFIMRVFSTQQRSRS